jgi:tricorn protease-like protein
LFTSIRLIAVLALALAASSIAYSQTKLLRFPDIRGDRVVFTYGGDLWTDKSHVASRRRALRQVFT